MQILQSIFHPVCIVYIVTRIVTSQICICTVKKTYPPMTLSFNSLVSVQILIEKRIFDSFSPGAYELIKAIKTYESSTVLGSLLHKNVLNK